MDLGLTDKVAVVTGGTAGIGLATARLLLAEGAAVILCGRDPDRVAAAIRDLGPANAHGLSVDVSDPAALERLRDEAVARFGAVDILVNNAGGGARAHALSVSDAEWAHDLDLKLMAHVRLARLVAPVMADRGGGAIVNVASIHGRHPGAESVPTAVSRAAGLAFAKALSRDLGRHNIRVNTVCIGVVKSEQHDRRWRSAGGQVSRDDFYRELAERRGVPLGRTGEADEAARAIAFLASDAASYVSGIAMNVDGGAAYVD